MTLQGARLELVRLARGWQSDNVCGLERYWGGACTAQPRAFLGESKIQDDVI